jgi:hypothetical protein
MLVSRGDRHRHTETKRGKATCQHREWSNEDMSQEKPRKKVARGNLTPSDVLAHTFTSDFQPPHVKE